LKRSEGDPLLFGGFSAGYPLAPALLVSGSVP
jgi:hypothetical protein